MTSAISCEITLDGTVESVLECAGRVLLADEPLACEHRDGCRMLDGSSRLQLLGAACDRFRGEPDATLEVSSPCDVFTPR